MSASFDGIDLHRPKWNGLLDHVHVVARQRLGSFEAVQKISAAHLRPGRYEEDSFYYLAAADLSTQGVDSNFAWPHSLGIAHHLRTKIGVKFEWRHEDGAARPGQVAILEWSPKNLAIAYLDSANRRHNVATPDKRAWFGAFGRTPIGFATS